jgi:hypothetical protein
MHDARRERIAKKLSEVDADLHALDAASPKCSSLAYPDRQAWLDAIGVA